MPTVTLKRAFRCDIADLWLLVTDLSCQSWRHGLAEVEVLSPGEFTERTSGGFVTRSPSPRARSCAAGSSTWRMRTSAATGAAFSPSAAPSVSLSPPRPSA